MERYVLKATSLYSIIHLHQRPIFRGINVQLSFCNSGLLKYSSIFHYLVSRNVRWSVNVAFH